MGFNGEHIWIIGASSGIGKALAKELASQGATLLLSARRKEELEALKDELGGNHRIYPLDVSDNEQVTRVAKAITASTEKIDRVIFMASVYKPAPIVSMDMIFAKHLVEVNLMGAIYVTAACLPVMKEQKSGQIVLCASVAGYLGLPNGQPYSAAKAGVINFAESLHAEVGDYIDIKVINPGFVRTPMTDKNQFHMPMRIEPEEAAKAIATGLKQHAFEIHFPKRFTYIMKFLASLPYFLQSALSRKMRNQ